MAATLTKPFTKVATDLGTYTVSRLSKSALVHQLRNSALTTFKQASLGGDQESSFEQAFSSLAYAYLKDKSPRLLDFIVGFQLVDRNEDNTKAVGIFGFKVGDQWLYAPVFFLNGDLKGHELLYIKKQDAFVPLKENWVNHLISRRPHVLGEGSEQNTFQLGGMMPSLMKLNHPPTGTKYGSAMPQIASWAQPALPVVFALGTKKAASLYEKRAGDLNFDALVGSPLTAALAPFAQKFDLRNVLRDFPLLKTAFEKCYTAYPLIKKGFDRFYGPDFFKEMAVSVRDEADDLVGRVKRAESYTVKPKPKGIRKAGSPYLFDGPAEKEKNAGLEIIALDLGVDEDAPGGIKENKPELTDEERQKLLNDTVLIKDKRENTSIAYNTQVKTELVNPSETGLYQILEKPGEFGEMVVISNPHSGRGREDFCLLIRKSSPRNWKNTHRTNLWAKSCDCPTPADWKKYVEGLGGTTDLQKGGMYVAVHENGSGTCPFKIKESFGDGVYSVSWEDSCSWGDRSSTLPKLERPQDWEIGYSSWDARVYINQRKGTGLKSVNGELSIPDSYKIIKISDPPKPKDEKDPDCLVSCCSPCDPVGDGPASEKQPIQPGNMVDVQLMLTKAASVMKLHDTGTEIVIRSPHGRQQLTKKAALISLVRDHGLREVPARLMLKAAAALGHRNQAAEFIIKYADGYGGGMGPGPNAPAFPEPYMGVEQHGPNATQAIYPQEEFNPVDGMSSQMTDPAIYDPFYQPDQGAMQVAQQAASGGQKEVFDTAMIGGMLKSVRQDSLVDRYLGDLMKALDKVGRIIFMFHWHNEEFEDRYGKQDLPELEDTLRNTFETLGDLTLFLKEKTVGGGANHINASGVGSADAGEPNIAEAARN